MNILPYEEKAIIPIGKLTDYALDFDKDPNKAKAFKLSLGYTKQNVDVLLNEIRKNLSKYQAVWKGNNGYGELYEVIIIMTGPNGKTANVLTAWIIEDGKNVPRLTNAYVTKKKIRIVR